MTHASDASAPADDLGQRLLALLAAGDVDGALQAGLMEFEIQPDAERHVPLRQAQDRLRQAWAARDRHRTRQARLARLAAEREARRRIPAAPAMVADRAPPALPPAAAAALARARAKAGGGHAS
ncbi:hypothetical protein [Pseudoxanthomonas koreensis]|uniref:hypothetical protein n=1 Tax=Pseudoxanthomonas koreensis TaxID=266061 RepID=UPI0035A64586